MTWHPILEIHELEPGRWELREYDGRPYGLIELRRTSDGLRFCCAFRGRVIGWSQTLRKGVEEVHRAFLQSHGPQDGSISDHGTETPGG